LLMLAAQLRTRAPRSHTQSINNASRVYPTGSGASSPAAVAAVPVASPGVGARGLSSAARCEPVGVSALLDVVVASGADVVGAVDVDDVDVAAVDAVLVTTAGAAAGVVAVAAFGTPPLVLSGRVHVVYEHVRGPPMPAARTKLPAW
jgi:hypothetical protein